MKSWMFEKSNAALSVTLLLAFLSSCSPESKNLSAYQNSNTESSSIIGGVDVNLEYQKQNGIVGLIIFEYVAVGVDKATGKIILAEKPNGDPVTQTSICSGTLINKNLVLTAAHCMSSPLIAGAYVFFTQDMMADVGAESVISVTDFSIHQDYQKGIVDQATANTLSWNDIALVKLGSDAPNNFKLARLPASATEIQLLPNSKLTLAGYGNTNAIVKKIAVGKNGKPVIIDGKAQTIDVESVGSGVLRKVDNIVVKQISQNKKEILLDQSKKAGACHGDSGGPAFIVAKDGMSVQVGITSRTTEKLGNCNEGAIYTNVASYLDWISEISKKLLAEPVIASVK